MATLETAIGIAADAHAGQLDRGGAPYILHPLRVMLNLRSVEEQIVGVLHDVLEDSKSYTLDSLRARGFSDSVLNALVALTRQDGEPYEDFLTRVIAAGPLASRVKFSDLSDNMDLKRIPKPTQDDIDRVEKRYRPAIARLRSAL